MFDVDNCLLILIGEILPSQDSQNQIAVSVEDVGSKRRICEDVVNARIEGKSSSWVAELSNRSNVDCERDLSVIADLHTLQLSASYVTAHSVLLRSDGMYSVPVIDPVTTFGHSAALGVIT